MQDRRLFQALTQIVGPSLLFREGRLFFESDRQALPLADVVLEEGIITTLERAGIRTLGDLHQKEFTDLQGIEGFNAERYYFLLLGLRALVQQSQAAEPMSPAPVELAAGSAEELLTVLGSQFWPDWPGEDEARVLASVGAPGEHIAPSHRIAMALFFASMIRSPRFEPFALACMSNIRDEPSPLGLYRATIERALGWLATNETSSFRVLLRAVFAIEVVDNHDGAFVRLAA